MYKCVSFSRARPRNTSMPRNLVASPLLSRRGLTWTSQNFTEFHRAVSKRFIFGRNDCHTLRKRGSVIGCQMSYPVLSSFQGPLQIDRRSRHRWFYSLHRKTPNIEKTKNMCLNSFVSVRRSAPSNRNNNRRNSRSAGRPGGGGGMKPFSRGRGYPPSPGHSRALFHT